MKDNMIEVRRDPTLLAPFLHHTLLACAESHIVITNMLKYDEILLNYDFNKN